MAVRYISNINARRTLFPTQQHGAQFISTILQIHSAVRTSDNRTMGRPRGTHVHCNHVAFSCPCSTYYGCIIAEWSPFVSPGPSTDTSDAVSVHKKTVNTDLSYEFARIASAIGLFLHLTKFPKDRASVSHLSQKLQSFKQLRYVGFQAFC